MESLISIDLSNFDTSLVISVQSMFSGCNSLELINLKNFGTSFIIDMNSMFSGCSSLKYIDLSYFDTSSVSNMHSLFYGCSSLTSIDLTNFYTLHVIDMSNMFYGCSSLKKIILKIFNTYYVTDMSYMFFGCSSLESIDLSNFDTFNVYSMKQMFYGCDSLTFLNIKNFNMINCYSYDNMFSNANNIRYIYLYNFTNDKIISKIFNEAENLLYVCQKEKIITNPKVYNCCYYNSFFIFCEINEPDTSKIPHYSDSIETSDSSTEINIVDDQSNKSSSNKISIGAIIGIIGEAIILISIVTIIICYCKKKKNETNFLLIPPPTPLPTHFPGGVSELNIFSITNQGEPQVQNEESKVTIQLITTSQERIIIKFDPEKTVADLIKFYFHKINRPELFGDMNIRFLLNAEILKYDSKELIKNKINKKNEVNTIVVDDLEDKI